ncbi:MAG: hypothetical protein K9H16_09320 [Bacteroidales bacterium]|nr:hypothetical protein [Bacteroidales bacterium]
MISKKFYDKVKGEHRQKASFRPHDYLIVAQKAPHDYLTEGYYDFSRGLEGLCV